jgi:hypothetical protein
MPKPSTPTLTPYADQLPDLNDASTWATRTPLFWNWVTGPGYENLSDAVTYADAAIDYIDAALAGGETVVDAVAAIPIIGIPFPVWTHIPGCPIPSNAGAAKFIELTAGLTGAGQYNNGLLGSESVSGTAPAITATATILVGPMAGGQVALINTEQAFIRPRTTSGTLQASQTQNHAHRTAFGWDNNGAYAWLDSNSTPAFGSEVLTGAGYLNVASAGTAGGNIRIALTENVLASVSGETAPRSRGARHFLRIA